MVDTLAFGGASMVAAASQDGRAAQQAVHPFVLSFNSADYDTLGVPTYMNGEHTISAQLMVASSDEPIGSGFHAREFDNGDGVHLTAVAPDGSALDSDGNVWYGGPGTGIEITAVPVVYSGGSAGSVTLLGGFCAADASSDEEAPFVFTPDCAKAGKTSSDDGVAPRFTLTVGGASIDVGADDILNGDDDIFPIRLDYQGPDAPHFSVNPNDREGGWVNAAVDFLGANGTGSKKDGWLVYNNDDASAGVGGYTPQIRFAEAGDDNEVGGALAATALTQLVLPPTLAGQSSKPDAFCVVARPSTCWATSRSCPMPVMPV